MSEHAGTCTNELAGKRALVTGAASGIGEATAVELAAAGADLVCADLEDCQATLQRIHDMGGSAQGMTMDVSDVGSVDAGFAAAGALDIVVNSAGILIESPLLGMPIEDMDRVLAVNLRGSLLVARAAASNLRDDGRLILIASELAHLGRPGYAAYCASKAGVIGLTRALARELAPRILVNCIAPGPTDTPMLGPGATSPEWLAKEADNPLQRIAQPEEIAASALFLSGPGASFMTGQTISPSGGAIML
jgi:3-oxoacyl-[acyl-carrier protein] reductase